MSIINPWGIIPAGFISVDKRTDALKWIRESPYSSGFRRGLARGWAAAVHVRLTAAEYDFAGAGVVRVKPVDVPTAIGALDAKKGK
jgi:hypothetical protein